MIPKIIMVIMIIWNMGFEIYRMTERVGNLGTSIIAAFLRAFAIISVL